MPNSAGSRYPDPNQPRSKTERGLARAYRALRPTPRRFTRSITALAWPRPLMHCALALAHTRPAQAPALRHAPAHSPLPRAPRARTRAATALAALALPPCGDPAWTHTTLTHRRHTTLTSPRAGSPRARSPRARSPRPTSQTGHARRSRAQGCAVVGARRWVRAAARRESTRARARARARALTRPARSASSRREAGADKRRATPHPHAAAAAAAGKSIVRTYVRVMSRCQSQRKNWSSSLSMPALDIKTVLPPPGGQPIRRDP